MFAHEWIVSYSANAIFWIWVIFFGGAEILEGKFASGLLISAFSPNWSAAGIRIFGWLTLLISTIGFLASMAWPCLRR